MKLVILDRDGVINEEPTGYITTLDKLIIIPQALKALALFKQQGFTCVVATNQSVVGRGMISMEGLNAIHRFLGDTIAAHGGEITEFYAATDHPDNATHRRKPGAGMLLEALHKYHADATKTPFVGDAITDMQAGFTAGCQRFLVLTGKGQEASKQIPAHLAPVTLCNDLLDAAQKITGAKL